MSEGMWCDRCNGMYGENHYHDDAAPSAPPSTPAAPPTLEAVFTGIRCTVCGGDRLRRQNGTAGACSFLECPNPLYDANRERPAAVPQGEPPAEHPYHEACPKCLRTKELLQKRAETAERQLREQAVKRMDVLLDDNCIRTIKGLPQGEEIAFGGVMGGIVLKWKEETTMNNYPSPPASHPESPSDKDRNDAPDDPYVLLEAAVLAQRDAEQQVTALEWRLGQMEQALRETVWRERPEFPGDPYCILCGAGKAWTKYYGHEKSCALALPPEEAK